MATVSGSLVFVSSRAAQVSEVWLHAREMRTHTTGVVTTGNDRFPVQDGEVSFTALPGPAVLALISQGRAVDTIPIVVGESDEQSLRNVVRAAQVVDEAASREIERLSAEMMEALDSAREHDESASGHAGAASSSAAEAKEFAGKAGESASSAALSSGAAAYSAESAEAAAGRAEGARSEARAAWDGAKEARDAAEGHASTAEGHATAAASSADDAEGAAGRADESAQQVREIAESTRWDGDQVTVNGQKSPHLTGPQGQRGPQGPPGTVDGIDFEQYAKVEQLSDVVREGTEANLSGIFLDNGAEDATGIVFQNRGAESYLRFSADNHLTLTNIDGDAERVVSMPDQWDFNTHVDMRGNQLRGLPAPSGDNHAATKSYVDGKAEGKQDKSEVLEELSGLAGTTSGIGGNSGIINNHANKVLVTNHDGYVTANDPRDRQHVANKQYVDSQVSSVRDRVGALESGGGGSSFWTGTKAEYDRISRKDANTLYIVRR